VPHPFRLYDTKTRKVDEVVPVTPGAILLYVCGMTVYDDCHAGHARAMVVFDAFRRHLVASGWNVTFVRNFTDVDDKIIARAAERGEDAAALAQGYVDRFREDVAALGLREPDVEPRVTGSMDAIVAFIEELVARGHAYAAGGNVWFDVASWPAYGSLSGQRVDALEPSADAGGGKRSAVDFALWKASKEGEPSWPSPWGPGRPGWHIECSAMARSALGATIDVHGGGLDLVFPHHENEIAQSEAANGVPFARTWMHNGLLTVAGGRKMGKSEGNAFAIRDLLALWPAEALRAYYLQNHYRSPLLWSEDALPEALAMVARLHDAREVAARMGGDGDAEVVAGHLGADAVAVLDAADRMAREFRAALDDDFHTPRALALAFDLARAVNRLGNHKLAMARGRPVARKALAALTLLTEHLGLLDGDAMSWHAELAAKVLPRRGLVAADVDAKLAARAEARASKDWARADALRAEIDAAGVVVMDRDGRSEWRVRVG
jgi:cysteinyl-tRNA synthetase